MQRLTIISIAFLSLCPLGAQAAVSYVVDDADITDPKMLQNENWLMRTDQHETVAVTNVAYQIFHNTEITLQASHDVTVGDRTNYLSPQIKYQLPKIDYGHVRTALVAGVVIDTHESHANNGYAYIPLSFHPSKQWDVNANVGMQYSQQGSHTIANWGIGTEYHATKDVSWVGEVFDVVDNKPGFQTGPRWAVSKKLQLDLVYGHNALNQNEQAVTACVTVDW